MNVAVRVTMPKSTTSVSCEPLGSGQRYEYKPQEKQFMWTIKKMQGGSTSECKAKVQPTLVVNLLMCTVHDYEGLGCDLDVAITESCAMR